MAQFKGDVQGARGTVSRLGHKNTGIRAHVRGWHVGVKVQGWHDHDKGEDVFDVYATRGSSDSGAMLDIGTVRIVNGSPVFTPAKAGK